MKFTIQCSAHPLCQWLRNGDDMRELFRAAEEHAAAAKHTRDEIRRAVLLANERSARETRENALRAARRRTLSNQLPRATTVVTPRHESEMQDHEFALVYEDAAGNKVRKLRIDDAVHVRAALAWFNQIQVPAHMKAEAQAKIMAAAKRLGQPKDGEP